MAVDIQTKIHIDRPRSEVAAYASDPDNATAWYENIKAVEWKSPKPAVVGARVAFVAQFLGRRLAYTYEIRELIPSERFVQSTSEGPFPMETTYQWEDSPGGWYDDDTPQPRRAIWILQGGGSLDGWRHAPGQSQGPQTPQGDPRGARTVTAPISTRVDAVEKTTSACERQGEEPNPAEQVPRQPRWLHRRSGVAIARHA